MSNPRAQKPTGLDSGRMGFRHPGEPPDERPVLSYRHPFWKDSHEQATYEAAVAMNPRRPDEGPASYFQRISELVTNEREAGAQSMPHVRQSRRERDAQLLRLRFQAQQTGGEE